jgi:acyl-CoA thioesterase FadM
VRLELNLKGACHQGDRLRIVTWPHRRGRTSFVLGQRIEKEGGAVAAEALVTLVTVDPEGRKPRPLPEELGRLFPEGG